MFHLENTPLLLFITDKAMDKTRGLNQTNTRESGNLQPLGISMSSPPAPAHHGIAVAKEMFSFALNGEIEYIFFARALFPDSHLDFDLDL
jgi:hypothetical protein